jgi:hypothetical protein
MDTSTVVWIIVAIAVIALIAVIAKMASNKKAERNREHAGELREQAAEKATEVQRREALAKETEAKAAAARAEADRKAAEADRLQADAQHRASTAAEHRQEHQEHLRKADELDPDVKHAAPTTAPDGTYDGQTTATSSTDEHTVAASHGETTSHRADEHDSTDETNTSHGGSHRAT